MDLVGGLIDSFIILCTVALLLTDIICIAAVIASDTTDLVPNIFSTASSILVVIFVLYRPAERLMPYARNVIDAILGL